MRTTRWAVLGPGEIGGWFARALPRSEHGTLHAVASRDPGRAEAFAREHDAPVTGTYDEILARDDVDAVYVATVHTTHADLAVAALGADKAVLCEKPVAPTQAETDRVLAAAAEHGVPFVEAYKHRFGPLARALDEHVARGDLGSPLRVASSFGFAAPDRSGRLFDPGLAGGAILDVGGYPVALAVALAAAAGVDVADLDVAATTGAVGDTGVDEHATATIVADGLTAEVACSIVADLPRSAVVSGPGGVVHLDDAYGSRAASAASFVVRQDGTERRVGVVPVDPFAAEADAVSRALADGRTEVPEMPWSRSRAVARLLDRWRDGLSASA
ncbi:Gfo/Idh/MocA family protein [Cellulosimicrobium marinum]|uniref:Gfo/Idh/MocA family protein n=1 Tax=Cellulosimicrobium marinum TaxID=1638992 RepID=UPI001E61043E|nr:Gfo/Idh/MocA family oxidoreductase [Cellulosimicrobium marinum]MCB7136280.1 Gfo/Idh/MocA family oxidoreductase [Cellulosimicrobium marinum]